MTFMVIELFKHGDAKRVGERFQHKGRMLPEGVTYIASWMQTDGSRCFQLMEAADPEALAQWMKRWDDLVNFEAFPVVTSSEFWARPAS